MKALQSVLFDLDDTLYPEMTFVTEALGEVGRFLTERTGQPGEEFQAEMLAVLKEQGRGKVFDVVLKRHGLPESWVSPMLHVYRSSTPKLRLFDDAQPLLDMLKSHGIRIGIVTDGFSLVQASKILCLGLRRVMDVVILTDTLGEGFGKPSPEGFVVALEMLDSEPEASAYVANDARKDFAGPRELNMAGVLVRRRILGDLDELPESHRPHYVVDQLSEVARALGIADRAALA